MIYPSSSELDKIRKWDPTDPHGLLAYVQDLWSFRSYFKKRRRTYRLSTGGWSGNEDIIGALQDNVVFWLLHWTSSKRGGHYTFEVTI